MKKETGYVLLIPVAMMLIGAGLLIASTIIGAGKIADEPSKCIAASGIQVHTSKGIVCLKIEEIKNLT